MAVKYQRWEYKSIIQVDDVEINRLGAEGWELVCAGGKSGSYLFFKRPLEQAEVKSEKKTFKYEEFI